MTNDFSKPLSHEGHYTLSPQEATTRLVLCDEILDQDIRIFHGGISFMVNNICNANCIFCAYQYNEDSKTTMSLELFKHALNSAMEVGWVGHVVLTPVAGEPLADPSLFEKIDYAYAATVKLISFSTNGILLTKNDNYKKILDRNVHLVNLSIPRLTKDAYERIYRSKSFDKVLDGIVKFLEYKEMIGATTQILFGIRLDVSLEEAMYDEGMKTIKPFLDKGACTIEPMYEYDNWSGHIKQENLTGIMKVKKVQDKTFNVPCSRMIDDLAILPDGKVRVCSCRYFKSVDDELVIGDITQNSMKEIHWGTKHKKLIQDVAKGNWPRVCADCTLYSPLTLPPDRLVQLTAKASQISAPASTQTPNQIMDSCDSLQPSLETPQSSVLKLLS